jgi:hypothetical protein
MPPQYPPPGLPVAVPVPQDPLSGGGYLPLPPPGVNQTPPINIPAQPPNLSYPVSTGPMGTTGPGFGPGTPWPQMPPGVGPGGIPNPNVTPFQQAWQNFQALVDPSLRQDPSFFRTQYPHLPVTGPGIPPGSTVGNLGGPTGRVVLSGYNLASPTVQEATTAGAQAIAGQEMMNTIGNVQSGSSYYQQNWPHIVANTIGNVMNPPPNIPPVHQIPGFSPGMPGFGVPPPPTPPPGVAGWPNSLLPAPPQPGGLPPPGSGGFQGVQP